VTDCRTDVSTFAVAAGQPGWVVLVKYESREKLMTIAAKCPVHRTLEGEVMFDERFEVK
jgi:hypothetical protein